MIELEIPDQHKLRWIQLTQMPMLEKVPYFHDAEIEYIKEIARLTAEVAALRAQVERLTAAPSDDEALDCAHASSDGWRCTKHWLLSWVVARAAAPATGEEIPPILHFIDLLNSIREGRKTDAEAAKEFHTEHVARTEKGRKP